ncbi:hypothetical protein ACO0K7_09305 [Undibacterium sp. Ji67W]|uniref:hypothetical protein n=1 Tax=Undibacterium sp. Ji67W TaxID=3413042 RepID=UPI003BF3BBBA
MGNFLRKFKAQYYSSLIFFSLGSLAALCHATPTLYGDTKAPECIAAYQLARTAFESNVSRMYVFPEIPNNFGSELVLGTRSLDISGGDALKVEEDAFENLPHSPRSIFWDRLAKHGKRIVVEVDSRAWRGDTYSLYLIAPNLGKEEFLNSDGQNYEITDQTSILAKSWRPPAIFRQKVGSSLWFILMGEPFEVLSDWTVYLPTNQGFKKGCRVGFRSGQEGTAESLPKSVQRLVKLLDDAVGSGNNEGTLQSTARIRSNIRHIWANAAIRPWALSDKDRYNSKQEVDDGLEAWSKLGPSYRKTYQQISGVYPIAERELSAYYVKNFQLQEKDARILASWVLEIIYCANFTFTNGQQYFRYDNVDNNPWNKIVNK